MEWEEDGERKEIMSLGGTLERDDLSRSQPSGGDGDRILLHECLRVSFLNRSGNR